MPSKSPSEFRVDVPSHGTTTAVVYSGDAAVKDQPRPLLILAHGAGAGQRSPFIVNFARALAALGVDVVTFNFLYTQQRRRMPDRAPILEACYRAVIAAAAERVDSAGERLFIGGKSMGGRIATQVSAADRGLPVAGIVLLGYPLHPPGRPHQRRDAHLPSVTRPMLFAQGSRDAFGTPAELEPILGAAGIEATIHVVKGGDHSFKLAGGSDALQAAVFDDVQRTIAEWISTVTSRSVPARPRSA